MVAIFGMNPVLKHVVICYDCIVINNLMQMTDSFFVNTVKKKYVFPVVASRYGAVLIPSAPGALYDLAQDNELAKLLNTFVQEKSECMQLLVYFSRHA